MNSLVRTAAGSRTFNINSSFCCTTRVIISDAITTTNFIRLIGTFSRHFSTNTMICIATWFFVTIEYCITTFWVTQTKLFILITAGWRLILITAGWGLILITIASFLCTRNITTNLASTGIAIFHELITTIIVSALIITTAGWGLILVTAGWGLILITITNF